MKERRAREPKTESRRFERRLPHRPEKVWRALTEARELAAWFPAVIEGEPANGEALRFVFPSGGEPSVRGAVTECDPPRVLAYTMGEESLRWELFPRSDGCLLVLTTESATANDNGNGAVMAIAA